MGRVRQGKVGILWWMKKHIMSKFSHGQVQLIYKLKDQWHVNKLALSLKGWTSLRMGRCSWRLQSVAVNRSSREATRCLPKSRLWINSPCSNRGTTTRIASFRMKSWWFLGPHFWFSCLGIFFSKSIYFGNMWFQFIIVKNYVYSFFNVINFLSSICMTCHNYLTRSFCHWIDHSHLLPIPNAPIAGAYWRMQPFLTRCLHNTMELQWNLVSNWNTSDNYFSESYRHRGNPYLV